MASVSTYLNFNRTTEDAFAFYKSVFGTEYLGEIDRLGNVPLTPGQPVIAENDKQLVMHVALPILAGHVLHGTDVTESMGGKLIAGNNVSIMLEPDTKAEADRLYAALAVGGKTDVPLQDMFWGDYFGTLTDKYGISWMFNVVNKKS